MEVKLVLFSLAVVITQVYGRPADDILTSFYRRSSDPDGLNRRGFAFVSLSNGGKGSSGFSIGRLPSSFHIFPLHFGKRLMFDPFAILGNMEGKGLKRYYITLDDDYADPPEYRKRG